MAKQNVDVNEIFLEAHERSLGRAVEISIRTGVPLVVSKKGKIVELYPKYEYVMVPIKSAKKSLHRKRKVALST